MSAATSPWTRRQTYLLAALLGLVGFFSAITPDFRSPEVLLDQSRYWVDIGILAPFSLLVIVAGGIDLSVASILALCGVTMARLHVEAGVPMAWAVVICLFLGALAGALNGAIIVRARIPDLVVTLATMGVYRGLAQAVAQDRVYSNLEGYRFFREELVLWSVLFFFWALAFFLLHRTRLGRYAYAVGSSPLAARFARVPAGWTRILLYGFSGLSAAAASIIYTARSNTAKSDDALGFELIAITCVVLGGASISGGRGNAAGLFLGVLIIGVLRTGMGLTDVPRIYQQFATGGILIFMAALNEWMAPRESRN